MTKKRRMTPSRARAQNERKLRSSLAHYTQRKGIIPSLYRDVPTDIAAINTLGDELLEWAQEPTSIDMRMFPILKRHSPYKFYKKLPEQSEYFEGCVDIALSILAARRENIIRQEGKDPGNIITRSLPLYDRLLRDSLREMRMNASIMDGNVKLVAVIDGVEQTEEVTNRLALKEAHE